MPNRSTIAAIALLVLFFVHAASVIPKKSITAAFEIKAGNQKDCFHALASNHVQAARESVTVVGVVANPAVESTDDQSARVPIQNAE